MTTTGVQFPKLALMESDKMQENIRKNVVAAKEFTHLFHPRIGNFWELPVTRSVSDTTMRKYLFSVLGCLTCENSCDMWRERHVLRSLTESGTEKILFLEFTPRPKKTYGRRR